MYNLSVLVHNMAKIIMFLLWLMVLIFIGFAVATFCAGFYIILLPLTVCIEDLKVCKQNYFVSISILKYFQLLTDRLLQGLQFPFYCANKMVSGGNQGTYLHI